MTHARFALLTVGLLACAAGGAVALDLGGLSDQDAARGIKGALTQGATAAVAKLGVEGGFSNNPRVKIPLPPVLEDISKGMRLMGRGRESDQLVASMNHAAEQAVPAAKDMLLSAVSRMSIEDAKKILTGGDGSVTRFFRDKTQAALAVKFLPVVKRSTDRVGLAQRYDEFAGQAAKYGVGKNDLPPIEQYVTDKALDGLYLMIGEEEHAIRQNPASAVSAIVSKVFGAVNSRD